MSEGTGDFDPGPPPSGDLTVRLREEQIEAFDRDGFTHVERITTDEELAWLEPLYDALFASGVGAWRGGYFDLSRPYESEGLDLVPQVLMPEVRFPALRQTLLLRNAVAIGAQLLGVPEEKVRSWGHMILKPPRVGGELPWHQDEAYWDTGFRYRALGCWMPLDPATRESGCMHFLPGSHLGPVREHRHIGDDPNVHGLVSDGVDARTEVAVPLAPGGATFHHCRTLHRTPPNQSSRVRRAWANELQVEPVRLTEAEEPDRPWVRAGREAWDRRQIRGRS
jgi:ectoine hydroxylase-related dioxygenase (phytanoyl-CoA dioxygenase family)